MPRFVKFSSHIYPERNLPGLRLLIGAVALLALLMLTACGGGGGGGGAPEPVVADEEPATTDDGGGNPSSIAAVTEVPFGDSACPYGGQVVDYGIDDNGNGALDADEVEESATICNGENGVPGSPGPSGRGGADGNSSLLATTAEPAGTNCTYGGQRVDVGLDDGSPSGTAGDGILQAGEIDDTQYICAAGGGSNEGTAAAPVPLTIDTPHEGTVAGDGTSYYKFTATATVDTMITLAGVDSDLGWTLYSDAFATAILPCDNEGVGGNEICTPAVTAGSSYYLAVREKSGIPNIFSIDLMNLDFLVGVNWDNGGGGELIAAVNALVIPGGTTLYRISEADGALTPLRNLDLGIVSATAWHPPTKSLYIAMGGQDTCPNCIYRTSLFDGVSTLVRASNGSGYGSGIPGMAPRHSDNLIFFNNSISSQLFFLDASTDTDTAVGALNLGGGSAMFFDGSGALYLLDYSNLYGVDPANGTSTLLTVITTSGNISAKYTSAAVRPSNGTVFVSSQWPALGTLDVCTGLVTEVAPFSPQIEGLTWVGGGAPPLPPVCASAAPGVSGTINVSWRDYPVADSFNIYWGTAPGIDIADTGTYSAVITSGSGTITHAHSGLGAGTYYYVITAVSGGVESPVSTEVSAVLI